MTEFTFITPLASQWARSAKTMKTLKSPPAKKWFGFLNIPEGQSGNFSITHRRYDVGTVLKTASARTQIFAGHECVSVAIPTPGTVVHELREDNGVWMTDLPIEQAQIDRDLDGMTGRVLVGGLGLGYAAQALALRSKVESVWVVEKSPEVIELVAKHLRGNSRKGRKSKIRVIQADLFEWLKHPDQQFSRFDWAFYDIWAPDGERVFFEQVVPLRASTGDKVDPEHVRCWNEDVMRGQLLMGLVSKLQYLSLPTESLKAAGLEFMTVDNLCELSEGGKNYSLDFGVPFFRAIRDGKVLLEDAGRVAAAYARDFGIPGRRLPW